MLGKFKVLKNAGELIELMVNCELTLTSKLNDPKFFKGIEFFVYDSATTELTKCEPENGVY